MDDSCVMMLCRYRNIYISIYRKLSISEKSMTASVFNEQHLIDRQLNLFRHFPSTETFSVILNPKLLHMFSDWRSRVIVH